MVSVTRCVIIFVVIWVNCMLCLSARFRKFIDYQEGPCPSVLKMDRVSWIRFIENALSGGSRALNLSVARSREFCFLEPMEWKLSCFPSHRLREVSWRQGGHMGLMLSSRHSVYIRESASPALCHSQGYGKLAWRSRVYGVSRLLEAQVTRHS